MAAPVFVFQGELLHQAAIYDQRDLLKSLLQAGVHGEVNSPDSRGLTPLHTAALHDSVECLKELLDWKGDPNIQSAPEDNCSTALHHAARNGHRRCLKVLVDAGARVDIKNKEGKTALQVAFEKGEYECGNYLRTVEGIRKAAREEEVSQELFRSCTVGDLPKVTELIEEASTVTINKLYQGGCTLLYKACQGGHLEVVKLLLNKGADGSPNTITGIAPLYAACLSGNVELVRLMVQTMPHTVNIPCKMDNSTALHVAAGEGNEEIVKSILQVPRDGEELAPCNKINMSVCTSNGMTALHCAAQGGFVKVAEQLLDCRHKCAGPCQANLTVSVNARSMGHTALHNAVKVGYRDVVSLLIKHGADINLSAGGENTLGENDAGASHVSHGQDKVTPLEIACQQGDLEMLKLLLNNGAEDVDHKCLNSAILADNVEVIMILLQRGAQVDQEHKLHPSRTSNSPEEIWRLSAIPISILWNNMKLTKLEHQWILTAAMTVNPYDGTVVGLHPSLKTITRVDISGNKLSKLPIVLFQMAALKTLTASENAITGLPSLWLGGKKDATQRNSFKAAKKPYSSCENIQENLAFEESEQDFTYAESGWNCPHLEEIELHHNSLASLPTCLFELPMLKYLNVSYNDIQTLPFDMWTAPVLKSLDLKGNFVRKLPVMKTRRGGRGGIGKTSSLPRAKALSLSKDSLPIETSQLNGSLEARTVKAESAAVANDKKNHPLKMFHHSQLWGTRHGDEIEDSDSEEEDIDPTKGSSLQKLDLSSNQIVKIPLGLSCLATNLATLNLSNNNICEVPSLALFPTSLGTLDLSHNNLTAFHPIAENIPYGGGVDNRCYNVVEGQRPSMRRRISAENGLQVGRVRLCRHSKHRILRHLKRLDLNNNKLEEIHFMLPRNRPASVATITDTSPASSRSPGILFPSLQSLTLSYNELWSLPKDVGHLSKLGSLHVSHTKITRLPPEVGLLSELWDLQYQGLQLQDIEPSVLERKKTKDIVGYLRSVLERSEPHPSMKLMFVGVANIGKTTLLNQLRQEGTGSYQNSPPVGWTERKVKKRRTGSTAGRTKKTEVNISTVGVDVCDWIYPKKTDFAFGRVDNRPSIKFSTWDFGGQREYYATHQCFLSHRSLYIAMWKVTDGEQGVNEIEPWLLNIQARAPDSPVIIVGTHYDMLEADKRSDYLTNLRTMISDNYIATEFGGRVMNTRERGLPKVMAMIEVSCKTGYHIRELRQLIYTTSFEIKEKGNRLPLLKTPIPASYIAVEDAVCVIRERCYRDDQTPVLKSEQFSAAVEAELSKQKVHLRGPEELQQATRYLHDNGVLLHYDDPLLRDLYFLDPQWLCDMLAHVVTVREVNPHINNGVMKRSDLSQIFRSERFPANLMSQYINLLSKFEVALPWSAEFLLVPSLLPDSQQETNQPVAAGVSSAVAQAMNTTAYTKSKVLRRQYVMSYVPSGFWPRMITRVIPDERIRDTVKSCCQLSPDGPVQDGDRDKLASLAQPEWSCWKTGVELSCFGVKLLRICELEGRPFYGAPDDIANPLHYRREVHDTTRYSTIEVITPCVRIRMEKFEQRKKVTKQRMNRGRPDEDRRDGSKMIGFKVKSVSDSSLQSAARLIAITAEHMDTLITDWFPGLDAITVQGNRLVTRIIPCPKCIMAVCGVDQEETEKESEGLARNVPVISSSGPDSGINMSTTDGSSTSASPWPSPVHVARRPGANGEASPQSQTSGVSDMLQELTLGSPQAPSRDRFLSEPERFTFGSVSTERETEEESSSCFDYTSDQSSDGRGSESSQSFSPEMGGRGRKSSHRGRRGRGSSDSDESDVADMNNKTKKTDQNKRSQEEPKRGSTDSTGSFNRGSCKYGSFRKRPTKDDMVIYSFEFEECVLAAYNTEAVECTVHGQLELKELAPDAMFEDIAPNMNVQASDITRGKFLGKGTFGSVFRGELKQTSGISITIAMKMPLNNEVGDDARPEEVQMAAAAMRALKENPTMALNDAYRTVRQEMSILLPLRHQNIVSLLGYCLNPFCMILEFAPQGALDRVLANYKRAGVRLNAYVMQKCIVQCASALKYLHRHHIIYRDLKSENILVWHFPAPSGPGQLSNQVTIKLADYGISRSAALAGMKGLGGTPGFMAPEIEKYVGKELYTDKVDSFSFGMYIYELVTLHQPFNDLNPAQVKQLIVEGHRPPLTAKDKKAPVFVLDLMAWCWQQEADKRPPSQHISVLASATEFPRLADVITFDKQLGLNCAVTAGSRVSQSSGADDRASVGSEVWLCRSELNAGIGTGKISVLGYSRGRCYHKKEFFVGKSCIRVACSVGSTVWLGTESGTLHVFCAMTYKQLCQGSIRSNRYILNMIHVPRANWVLVALADGSVLAYNDHISNHYHYSESAGQTPVHELLPNRVYTGNGIPIHCMAALPLKKPQGNEAPPEAPGDSSEDSDDRNSPRDEYVCEVWCGQEKGRITILDGEELQKICTKSAEDSEPDSSSQREHSVSHLETCQTTRATISGDDPVGRSVWVALFPGTRVFRWDALEKKIVRSVDCSQHPPRFEGPKAKVPVRRGADPNPLSASRAQVNSLLAVDKELYIGTSFGCILVCNNLSLMVYTIIRCHDESVKHLLPLVTTPVTSHSSSEQTKALVLSCGRGYRSLGASLYGHTSYPSRRSGKTFLKNESVALVWLADVWES